MECRHSLQMKSCQSPSVVLSILSVFFILAFHVLLILDLWTEFWCWALHCILICISFFKLTLSQVLLGNTFLAECQSQNPDLVTVSLLCHVNPLCVTVVLQLSGGSPGCTGWWKWPKVECDIVGTIYRLHTGSQLQGNIFATGTQPGIKHTGNLVSTWSPSEHGEFHTCIMMCFCFGFGPVSASILSLVYFPIAFTYSPFRFWLGCLFIHLCTLIGW